MSWSSRSKWSFSSRGTIKKYRRIPPHQSIINFQFPRIQEKHIDAKIKIGSQGENRIIFWFEMPKPQNFSVLAIKEQSKNFLGFDSLIPFQVWMLDLLLWWTSLNWENAETVFRNSLRDLNLVIIERNRRQWQRPLVTVYDHHFTSYFTRNVDAKPGSHSCEKSQGPFRAPAIRIKQTMKWWKNPEMLRHFQIAIKHRNISRGLTFSPRWSSSHVLDRVQ